MRSDPVFHVAEVGHWEEALRRREYRRSTVGRTLEEEGFIHCSTRDQLPGVLHRYYSGYARDLVLLTLDTARLGSPVVWEVGGPGTGEEFPHVYGPIRPEDVTATQVLHPPYGLGAGPGPARRSE